MSIKSRIKFFFISLICSKYQN